MERNELIKLIKVQSKQAFKEDIEYKISKQLSEFKKFIQSKILENKNEIIKNTQADVEFRTNIYNIIQSQISTEIKKIEKKNKDSYNYINSKLESGFNKIDKYIKENNEQLKYLFNVLEKDTEKTLRIEKLENELNELNKKLLILEEKIELWENSLFA